MWYHVVIPFERIMLRSYLSVNRLAQADRNFSHLRGATGELLPEQTRDEPNRLWISINFDHVKA